MANGKVKSGAAVLDRPMETASPASHGPSKAELETMRLAALDRVTTNVMIADAAYQIIYMNEGVTKLLTDAEREIQKDLPNFDASRLLGSNIDVFHKNPLQQRRMLEGLTGAHKAFITLGRHNFDLMASPVFDPKTHARIGTMVEWSNAAQRLLNLDYAAQIAAVGKSQAVIEFEMDGTVIAANDNFLKTLGYTMDEIKGRHHSMFVDEAYRQSGEYREFWAKLNRGEYQAAEYKRIGKGGKEVWIQASYNPIFGPDGKPFKVVKFATDVTEQKLISADYAGQIAAASKSQAVIQFKMDGTVITANDNFLKTLGYTLEEIQGRHHSMFVDESFRQSSDYREFWAKLNRGEYQAAEYKRIGKGGKEVWIQASYNPIFDLNGKPFKVVKFAIDVTGQKQALNAMLADAAMLTKAAVEGKLATRADANKHQGDFRKVVEGVNATLDAVIGPLNVSAEYVDRISKGDIPPKITDTYNGDFNEIKNNLNNCIDNINALTTDAGLLVKAAVDGKLATRADASKHQGDYRKIVEGVNQTLDAVIGPLNVSAEYVDRISKGDIPPKITDKYNGDFNEIKNNLNNCIDNITALVTETGALIKASAAGQLATRADASRHHGDFRKIVEGVNEMLDAILLPIGEGNRILGQISNGKIDELIAQTYQGDHEKMKQAVNNVATVIQGLQKELGRLTVASRDGQLSERGKSDQFQGAYAGIVKGVNEMLDAILLPIGEGNRILAQISNGKIDELIAQTYKGDHEKMKQAVNNVAAVIQGLQKELGRLTEASRDGQLSERGKPDQFQGAYAGIVKGVNEMLDAILLPIGEGNRVLAQISNGRIDELIAQTYKGDHEKMKQAINGVASTLQGMSKDVNALVKAAVEGKLATRADATKHPGEYRKIVEGVNQTLDAVIGPLNVSAEYVDRISKGDIPPKITDAYNGDFNEIKNNLNNCIEAMNCLKEADGVLRLMSNNDYSKSVVSKAGGVFGEVAASVNTTCARVTHLADTVGHVSKGDLTELPEYKKIGRRSENDILVPSLIALMENLKALVDDATMLSKAAVEGALNTRADASKHQGDYRKVVEGVNQCLDAVLEPIQEAAAVIEKVAAQDLTARVEGKYRGDHAAIKNNINRMGTDLRSSIQQIAQNASVLASAAEELTASSQQMAGNAEETATQANVVSAAAEQVSKNVSVVATGAEQMQTSIREIAKSANEAAKIAKSAVKAADATNKTIGKLGESSLEIGKVIKVITSIAQQTNLLALNATIEAARAGEAGKGFAVVANEVKELAKETAKATEDIGQKIEAIQSDTKGAVQAIAEIGTVINQVNDISNTIASAVEEQTVTTNEIGRNVAEAARGTSDIAKNISGVAQAAQNTTQGASDSQKASSSLAAMAAQLQGIVGKFKL
jgi:PAS domain S-box-containing protein